MKILNVQTYLIHTLCLKLTTLPLYQLKFFCLGHIVVFDLFTLKKIVTLVWIIIKGAVWVFNTNCLEYLLTRLLVSDYLSSGNSERW